MRSRPLPPEFLEELRATEKAQKEAREAQFEADRKKELEKEKLRIVGLRAEKEIRKHMHEYQKDVVGTETLAVKMTGEVPFKKNQVIGRYKVISDGAMMVMSEREKGARAIPTLRMRCVCGHSTYMRVQAVRAQIKRGADEWGCNSKKCLNKWRQEKRRK